MKKEIVANIKEHAKGKGIILKSLASAYLYEITNGFLFEISTGVNKKKRQLFVRFSCKPYELDDLFWEITENQRLSNGKRVNGVFVIMPFQFSKIGPIDFDEVDIIIAEYLKMKAYFGNYKADQFMAQCQSHNAWLFDRNKVLKHLLLKHLISKDKLIKICDDFIEDQESGGFSYQQPDGTNKTFFEYYREYLMRKTIN